MITEHTLASELTARFATDSLAGLRALLFSRWESGDIEGATEIGWFLEELITSADYPTQDRTIVEIVNDIDDHHGTLPSVLGPTTRKWWLYHRTESAAVDPSGA